MRFALLFLSFSFGAFVMLAMENVMKMLYTRLKISLTLPLKHKPALVFHVMRTLVWGIRVTYGFLCNAASPNFDYY